MRIDVHNHFAPAEYLDILAQRQAYPWAERTRDGYILRVNPMQEYPLQDGLHRIDARLKDMDAAGLDMQVVACICPAGETSSDPGLNLALAQAANDGIARLAKEQPGRFVGMASLPLLDPPAALKELDRAVNQLGMKAVMFSSNIGGKMLDDPDLWPIYQRLEELDIPILVHPSWPVVNPRPMQQWRMSVVLGFLFDTTLAMCRIILSGLMDRYPNLKLILCHCGSTMTYLAGRLDRGIAGAGSTMMGENTRPPSEYFKRFYLDTVCYHQPSIMCAHATSGVDKLLYGSDYPYGPIPPTIEDVETLPIPQVEIDAIMAGNATRLLKLS